MDSESDWDTASEAETKSPKRINTHYPKIDGILEVPEENNWNSKEYKQYTTDDEDQSADIHSVRNHSSKAVDSIQQVSRSASQRQTSAGSSGKSSQKHAAPAVIGDFKPALNDPVTSKNGYRKNLPGKERKGHLYDPPNDERAQTEEEYGYNLGSWDSEDDARALADIRAVYERGKTQEEEIQKKLESSAIVLEIKEPESPGKADREIAMKEENIPPRSGQAFVVEDEEETRIIYPFEESHKEYYHAVEPSSQAFLPNIADKSEAFFRRCWQEVFGALRIVTGFVFIFAVELLLFVFRDTVYKLLMKIIVILGSFVVKPLLSNTFNSFIQPPLVFAGNVLTGVRSMMAPVADISKSFVQQAAYILSSFRLVEIRLQSTGAAGKEVGPLNQRMINAKVEELPSV